MFFFVVVFVLFVFLAFESIIVVLIPSLLVST